MKKQEENKKLKYRECLCDTPKCGKCLTIGCEKPDCSVHTIELKLWYKRLNPDRFAS